MAFIEVEFPRSVSFGARGRPNENTQVVEVDSGARYKNSPWAEPLREYDVAHLVRTQTLYDLVKDFHYAVGKGRKNQWRYWDPSDYKATSAQGRLAAVGQTGTFTASALGSGVPTYQLGKRYSSGGQTRDREIKKPSLTAGINTIYRNGSPVTFGAAPGNCALATATGIVTFVADDSEAVTGHTPGASHVFTTAADIPGLAIGEKVYLTGITGTAAATLNALAHTISNKTGAGPYTWTISTATTGLTASGGTAFEYPQASDALTWAGEYNVPAEFGIDELEYEIVGKTPGGVFLYSVSSIPILEVRV
jgi:uncharacterized protein (TIGR02217 family)